MASSTRASSRPSRLSSALLEALRKPAAFFASNWAALLGVVSVVGIVPGLAGVERVVTDLDRYSDEPFMTVLRQIRTAWRRDLPVSLLLLVVVAFGLLDVWVATQVDASVRVAALGFLIPVMWGTLAFVGAYVAAASAQPVTADRHEVLGLTATLAKERPVRSLLTPLLLVALSPVILLPPITVAVGLSLPAWVLGEWYGVRPWRDRLDPEQFDG